MSGDHFIPPPIAPAIEDLLTTTARDALRMIVETGDLTGGDGEAWLIVPATPALIDALAAFEAELADLEDDDPREEGADAEPSLGSIDNRMDQDQAWRVQSNWELDLEFDGDTVADADREAENEHGGDILDEPHDENSDEEPSFGATIEIDQRLAWRQPASWTYGVDHEAEGTIDDLVCRPMSAQEREATRAATQEALGKLRAIAGVKAYGGKGNVRFYSGSERYWLPGGPWIVGVVR